jgi:hypothetical protein
MFHTYFGTLNKLGCYDEDTVLLSLMCGIQFRAAHMMPPLLRGEARKTEISA